MDRKITLNFKLDGEDVEQRYADLFHAVWMIAEVAQLGRDFIVEKDDYATKASLQARWIYYDTGSRWT